MAVVVIFSMPNEAVLDHNPGCSNAVNLHSIIFIFSFPMMSVCTS
jgi:hypothetical protein